METMAAVLVALVLAAPFLWAPAWVVYRYWADREADRFDRRQAA